MLDDSPIARANVVRAGQLILVAMSQKQVVPPLDDPVAIDLEKGGYFRRTGIVYVITAKCEKERRQIIESYIKGAIR